MSFLNIFTFFSVLVSVATAVRFDLTNVTCKGLHGPHCGTYVMEVVGQNGTFLGQSTFVGADVLTESSVMLGQDIWARKQDSSQS
ncbi:Protein VEL1 [Saccharomyces cerevisiae]|nr:Protein VEL1 [Saccharomyces cerevisiae]